MSGAIRDGPVNDYGDHVDHTANRPTNRSCRSGYSPPGAQQENGNPPQLDSRRAEIYGELLGRRYRDAQIIGILGGDRNIDSETQKLTVQATARGRKDDGGTYFVTATIGWSASAR